MNMLFADTMKKLREEKGLSQNEIAKRMYVTRTTVFFHVSKLAAKLRMIDAGFEEARGAFVLYYSVFSFKS